MHRTTTAEKRLLELAGDVNSVDDAIRVIASRLLDGSTLIPTNLAAIANKLNVTSISGRDLYYDGHLLVDGDGELTIEFDNTAHELRQRFTIAHELGHAVFASTGRGYPRSGEEVERLCNRVATELLMPTDMFKRTVRQPITLRDMLRAARVFRSSVSATAVRCAELCGAQVFETSKATVRWSRVRFVARGPVTLSENSMQKLVTQASAHKRFRGVVLCHWPDAFGWWLAESLKLSEQRCLFLLRRATAEEVAEQREALIA